MVVRVVSYKLRGGQVQPIGTCGSSAISGFVMQTFGAEKIVTYVYDDKTDLLRSTDFQGLKGGDLEDSGYINSTYARASYQCRPFRTTTGEVVFSASEEHVSEFIDEDQIGSE